MVKMAIYLWSDFELPIKDYSGDLIGVVIMILMI